MEKDIAGLRTARTVVAGVAGVADGTSWGETGTAIGKEWEQAGKATGNEWAERKDFQLFAADQRLQVQLAAHPHFDADGVAAVLLETQIQIL